MTELTSKQNQQLQALFSQVRSSQHRLLVHLEGEEVWAKAFCKTWLDSEEAIWLENASMKEIRQLLGTDQQTLVINAWRGFNPNALGISSPTLSAGGILVLITPPLDAWSQYPDPDYQRMLAADQSPEMITGRFIQHISTLLDSVTQRLKVSQQGDIKWPAHIWPKAIPDDTFAQQKDAIDAIARVARGHARRPLVLTADRGRGKTAALGLASAKLLDELPPASSILVTAPIFAAVECLFRHCAEALGFVYEGEKAISWKTSSIRFVAPDVLIEELPDAALVIVDEAAAIPTGQLTDIMNHYNRMVFSTTEHGYEGNGRGFALRFKPRLQVAYPATREIHLSHPIRFAPNDPVEAFTNAALLLDKPPETPLNVEDVITKLQRDELIQQPDLLHSIFSLLVDAHYQTSPDDLRILLDHPDVECWVQVKSAKVIAVAMLMKEGGFSSQKIDDVEKNHRRFRGHLMPQALNESGHDDVLNLTYKRVMRIAVDAQCRRKGIGKSLLMTIEQKLTEAKADYADCADYIGASFSCENEVLAFWQACGYTPVRLGTRKESSTGHFAAMVLKPLNGAAERKCKKIHRRFVAQLNYQMLRHNSMLSPITASLLYRGSHPTDVINWKQVIAYGESRRSFEVAQPDLHGALLRYLAQAPPHSSISCAAIQLLCLNGGWLVAAKTAEVAGRKPLEVALKQFFAGIADQFDNNEPQYLPDTDQ